MLIYYKRRLTLFLNINTNHMFLIKRGFKIKPLNIKLYNHFPYYIILIFNL